MKFNLLPTVITLTFLCFFTLHVNAQWSTNANSVFLTNAAKNVGLGTTSPHARLQFDNVLANRKIVLHENANNNHQFFGFGVNSAAMRYQVGVNSSHIFYAATSATASAELLRIKSSGEVGIGTANPNTKLHINGTGIDNNGITAVVRIVSGNGAQNLLLDGNEIDALADGLYLNNNTNQDIVLVNGGGKVGIGTNDLSSNYKLRVQGSAFATGLWFGSDQRYKDNIQTLGNALQKVLALRGTEYTFRTTEFKDMNFDAGKQIGFIAQEMKQVLPELVIEDAMGYHAVNYLGLVPVLVEAIKEQHAVIAEKETRIAALEAQNTALLDRLARIEATLGLAADRQPAATNPTAVTATISPNPTSGIVTIGLKNTASAKSVTVRILDNAGRELASRSTAGEGSIQFDLSQFPAGVYVAQVVADGKLVSANKVQLVK